MNDYIHLNDLHELFFSDSSLHCLSRTSTVVCLGVQNKCNNQTVETKNFSENQNQNHSDKQTALSNISTNTLQTCLYEYIQCTNNGWQDLHNHQRYQ